MPIRKIIIDPPLAAEENMRKDEAAFRQAEGMNKDEFIVRIYEWEKATISLGFSQKTDALDMQKIAEENISVVRRITGGRAVLHDREITYSVSAPLNSIYFGGDLYGSFKKISEALTLFFKDIHVDVYVQREKLKGNYLSGSPVCFDSASLYEIKAGEHKICGSAQKRNAKAFMQHGSIPLITPQNKVLNYYRKKIVSADNDFLTLNELCAEHRPEILKGKLKEAFIQYTAA